jgi:thioredoxin reductase (NADPH)
MIFISGVEQWLARQAHNLKAVGSNPAPATHILICSEDVMTPHELPLIHTPSLVIGAGPAGYTAAIYLARYGRQPVVVTGPEPGGQLTLTTDVENFPGFAQPVQGPDLMDQCRQQAVACGATLHDDWIVDVDFTPNHLVCVGQKRRYACDTVVIATGASTNWLGLESETFFRGYGVSSCATCDGPLFRGKPLAVVGGGNTAAEEALFLAQHASRVTLIHRRDTLRADKVLQSRLFDHDKIDIMWNHVVDQVVGQEDPKSVTGIIVRDVTNNVATTVPVQGLFIAIGHAPNTALFKNWLPTDDHGYLMGTPGSSTTPVPGVFVAGDVQDKVYRQAITAAGQGCMAAMDAERFLQARSDRAP